MTYLSLLSGNYDLIMNIISLTCNGLGASWKKDEIKSLIMKERPTMVMGLQETKMQTFDRNLARFLWGNWNLDFSVKGYGIPISLTC